MTGIFDFLSWWSVWWAIVVFTAYAIVTLIGQWRKWRKEDLGEMPDYGDRWIRRK